MSVLCSSVHVHLIISNPSLWCGVKRLAQVQDIFETLEEMRENLQEALREAATLQRVAIEEEVLIGADTINKTCNNMLRDTKRIETHLRHSSPARIRRH